MTHSLLPRLLFGLFLACCAAAPLLLGGCGDTTTDSSDLSVIVDHGAGDLATLDLRTPVDIDAGEHD